MLLFCMTVPYHAAIWLYMEGLCTLRDSWVGVIEEILGFTEDFIGSKFMSHFNKSAVYSKCKSFMWTNLVCLRNLRATQKVRRPSFCDSQQKEVESMTKGNHFRQSLGRSMILPSFCWDDIPSLKLTDTASSPLKMDDWFR